MQVLGLELAQSKLYFCLLSGDQKHPIFLKHGIRDFSAGQPATELMNFFNHTFSEIIDEYSPQKIGYRVAMSAGPSIKKIDQYPYLYFSYGILNLIAHNKNIPTTMYNTNSFTAAFFGRKGDKKTICDELIGIHPPNWNDSARMAALSAYGILP